MDLEEEVVVIRRLPEEELSVREVRISCPDATGLGVDLTRMLLDFGLRVIKGDISTDGRWCFLIFVVSLSSGVPPRWQLLKQRLEAVCPSGTDSLRTLLRWKSVPREQMPFLLQVSSYDRQGMLHSLTHALWESDTTVFKAHITTSPAGEVADLFWLVDNKDLLPEGHRALEVCDRVKGVLGPDAECTLTPAPAESLTESGGSASTTIMRRKACKDASSASNLRRIVAGKSRGQLHTAEEGATSAGSSDAALSEGLGPAGSLSSAASLPWPLKDPFAEAPQDVEVIVDNETSAVHTMLTLHCVDRKGLLFDIFRSLKDVDIRVAYGRIEVFEGGTCEVDLFVQDAECCRISDSELLEELTERVRTAVALPVRIDVRDAFDTACTELTVMAAIDSGGRGRPRVTFDVTQGLNVAGVGVFMADVYIERADPQLLVAGASAQEMHRFLIHLPNGQAVRSEHDKKAIYDVVRAHLMGTSPQQQFAAQQLAATAGASPFALQPQLTGTHSALEAGNGGGGMQPSLLRSLSAKWNGRRAAA